MKKKLAAGLLGLFLIIRLIPAAAIFWAKSISLPVLNLLEQVGNLFPFVLLEWCAGGCCILMLAALVCRCLKRVLAGIIAVLLSCALVVWYPLYFLPQPVYSAGAEEISLLCESLINELNEHQGTFTLPDDLPAKFIRFPQWMDALNISGLCSFLTGEALISPAQKDVSLPFVAVHELMHLRGYAGEGAANIAAWDECMTRGGTYAVSARVWALRYGMDILRKDAPTLYETNILRMNHETLQVYREAGGAYSPAPQPEFLQRIYAALGIENAMQDYEILAPYLAAQCAG